jgi:general secretion pathway protein G
MRGIVSLFMQGNDMREVRSLWCESRKREDGFTLLEILVVIAILGILASLIAVRIMDRPGEARVTKAQLDVQTLENALKLYKLDNGVYPSTDQGLRALVEKPGIGRIPGK